MAMGGGVPEWVKHAVYYQVFPDRFARSPDDRHLAGRNLEPWDAVPTRHGYKGGTLRGIRDRLDHIKELGANVLYLNPIFLSASNHRYHCCDYFQVDPLLGGDAAFDDLLAAAHAKGLRVMLDGVFNHVGRGFFQFIDVIENGRQSPWVDWFRIEKWPIRPFGRGRPNYACWADIPALPQLNHDNPEVREYLYRVAEHWTAKGIDGWRLDTPDCVPTPGFWEEFRSRVRAINPEAAIIGEVVSEAPDWVTGTRCDGLINYPLSGAVIRFAGRDRLHAEFLKPHLTGTEPLDGPGFVAHLNHLLALYPWPAPLAQMNFLETHDMARFLSIVGGDRAALRVALMLLVTLPGAPCVYYGGEVGLAGGQDPDCRRGFPPEERWDRQVLALHRELIAVRRAWPALREGAIAVLAAKGAAVAYARTTPAEAVLTAVNAGARRATLTLPAADLHAQFGGAALFGGGTVRAGAGGALVLDLPPGDGVILAGLPA